MAPTSNPLVDHELTCLGVGEGRPSKGRRQASFLYRFGPAQILVDCGDGMSLAFLEAGADYESLDAILLSHLHSDHVGGFSMFVQSLWLSGRRRSLPVYAPARALPALQAWLDATLLPADLIGFHLEWKALEGGKSFPVGPVTITPYPTSHLDSLSQSFGERYPAAAFEAFSFVLEDQERRVAHTADIGTVSDLDPLLATRPALLVSELSHIGVPDLAARLRLQRPGQVVFMHVANELLVNGGELQQQLGRELGEIPFVLATDGEVIPF